MGAICGKKSPSQSGNNPTDKPTNQNAANGGKLDNNSKSLSFNNKKKMNRADYRFQDQKDKFLFKESGQIDGMPFDLLRVDACTVYLHDWHNQSFVDYVTNSTVVFGPQNSSIFIRNCENCQFVVACQQLRLRDCKNLQIMLMSVTAVSARLNV